MKKIHLIAAGTVLMLTACSNDEMVEAPQATPIAFDSYVGKTTRATDATLKNLTEIKVYGYISDASPLWIFDGTPVSKPENKDWEYSPLQYWVAGKNYFFTSVASPVSTQGNSHYTYTKSATVPMEVEGFCGTGTIGLNNSITGASGNEDLVYAYATAVTSASITSAPERVKFNFKHALSRVKFSFKNMMGSDAYSIKVHDLKIHNAAAEGSLTLGEENPVWTASGTAELNFRSEYYEPASGEAGNAATVASGTKFIIPETKELSISFTVDLIVNGTVIASYQHSEHKLPSVEFKNGYSYNFVADLNPENIDHDQDLYPILFSVTEVDAWTETADTDFTPEKVTPGE